MSVLNVFSKWLRNGENLPCKAETYVCLINVQLCCATANHTHPVLSVDILVGVPFAREKWVLGRNDLAVEEGGQHRILGGEAGDFQVAAQIGVLLVDML